MGDADYKAFTADSNMRYLEKIAVIKNYYLVIGGGKVGSRKAKVLKNESELVNLLKKRTAASLQEMENNEPEAYFYKTDIHSIPLLLAFGIPEYIIPAVPCPTFGREKPKTVTEYAMELHHTISGWVFESHQMKPGIGGLKGMELKQNLLEILEFIGRLKEEGSVKEFEKLESRTFFLATTCTCHGVLNLFYVKQK